MALNIKAPKVNILKPKIAIFGVGGAGGNAINNMIKSNLEGVEFIAANTDSQALATSLAENKIQLGVNTTKGLGAGSFPDQGKAAAEEDTAEIEKYLDGCNMVFIAAGMGGGTGTGAAPVIAKLAKEKGILAVGVVTKPFSFEGKYRSDIAEAGIEELKKHVDTLIIIPNQNLFRIANENTTFESAFKMADDVLHAGVRGITDLITMPGLVNLDFADIRTIMTKMGKAMMGTGEAQGENRAILACEAAISNPLLDDVSIRGAKGVLVNMTGGPDMTLFEADAAVNAIRKEVDANANIIFGSAFNEDMKGKIRISVVATGIDEDEFRNKTPIKLIKDKEEELPLLKKDEEEIAAAQNLAQTNSGKAYFDPGISDEEEKLTEIEERNFQVKHDEKIVEEDVVEIEEQIAKIDLSKNKTEKDFTQISFFEDELEKRLNANILEAARQEEIAQREEKNKKKESFGLFNFLNSGKKEKVKEVRDEKVVSLENKINWAGFESEDVIKDKNSTKTTKSKSFDQMIFSQENDNGDSRSNEKDDIDIPAFFRRNK